MNEILITEKDIIDQIKCLDTSKSYGPDGISPVFIKEGQDTLAKVFLRLFNLSLSTSRVPRSFKQANVVPIHKKDSKSKIPMILL